MWFRSKASQILHEILAGEALRIAEARKIELEYAKLEAEIKLKAAELRAQRKISPYMAKKAEKATQRSMFEKAGFSG